MLDFQVVMVIQQNRFQLQQLTYTCTLGAVFQTPNLLKRREATFGFLGFSQSDDFETKVPHQIAIVTILQL
jgi:hypothetical protein